MTLLHTECLPSQLGQPAAQNAIAATFRDCTGAALAPGTQLARCTDTPVVAAGGGVIVTGTGSAADPYVVTSRGINGAASFSDAVLDAEGQNTTWQSALVNPYAKPIQVNVFTSWNAGAASLSGLIHYLVAQEVFVDGVMRPEITSMAHGGESGGYDTLYSADGLSTTSGASGFLDSSFGATMFMVTVPANSTVQVQVRVTLSAFGVSPGATPSVAIQSRQIAFIGFPD